jgi:hypothetical protein
MAVDTELVQAQEDLLKIVKGSVTPLSPAEIFAKLEEKRYRQDVARLALHYSLDRRILELTPQWTVLVANENHRDHERLSA